MWRPAWVFVTPGPRSDLDEGLPVPARDQALLAWRDWCAAHEGTHCRVGLSGQWVMSGVVPQDVAATPAAAIDAMAINWDHYANVSPAQLQGAWLVRATRSPGAWLVCATPRGLVEDLQAIAKVHGVSVAWMGPWWARGFQRWLSQPRAGLPNGARVGMGACEPGWTQWLEVEAGGDMRAWAEPVTQAAAPGGALVVELRPPAGSASATHVWDGASAHGLLQGSDPAWGRAA